MLCTRVSYFNPETINLFIEDDMMTFFSMKKKEGKQKRKFRFTIHMFRVQGKANWVSDNGLANPITLIIGQCPTC